MIERAENWLIRAPGELERVEACFSGRAFAPHRHDTYAIGITLEGVQSFDYRGAPRHSLPGQLVILHPDEQHDGRAGDGRSFRYRTAYIAPADIQAVLAGRPLPFVSGAVRDEAPLRVAVMALLGDYGRPLSVLEQQDGLYELATALQAAANASGEGSRVLGAANWEAASRARDYIEASVERDFCLVDLERETRHDRWSLSRDFRRLFGTSPYRYLILRRLDRARALMLQGAPLAQAACGAGFADQSHFNRLFKRAFGLTPMAWRRALNPHDRSIPGPGGRLN